MESRGTGWLVNSLHAVDNNVKQLLQLIEDNNIQVSSEDALTKDQNCPDIATYVDDLHSQYHLLAERYTQLVKEQGKSSHELDENLVSPFYTPVSKLTELQAVGSESDRSHKSGYGSSSTSLSDSDLENPNPELDGEKRVAHNRNENNLLKQIEEYEAELQIANAKVKLSKDDVAKFMSKLGENEEVVKQLKDELEVARALVNSKDEVIGIKERKVTDLEGMISSNADKLSNYSEEVQRLKKALVDAQNVLLIKEQHYQSEMSGLLEQKNSVESKFDEQQLQLESLKSEVSALKFEIAQVKSAHDVKEASWETEKKSLEAENVAKSEDVEILNKCVDALKLKYDMANARVETLTAELSHKDNVIQQLNESINHLNSVNADLNVNIGNLQRYQNAVRQLEDQMSQVKYAFSEALSKSDKSNAELIGRVSDLEEELEEQRALVAEGAELKREAIRQLCISLDHYRSEYLELREACVGKKRRSRTDTESQDPSSS